MISGSKRQALSASELADVLTRTTDALRTIGHPGDPFGSATRISEAPLLRAFSALVDEVGVHLRAREIVTEDQVRALATPARSLAAVLAGPDVVCGCRHAEPGDHRSDGCNWANEESGAGCDCDQRTGAAPTATRIWLQPSEPADEPF